MKNITVYYLSVARTEYTKKRGEYPIDAYEVGSGFDGRLDEEVEDIFTNVEDAIKALSKEKTYIHDDGKLMYVEEYATVERFFDLDEIIEEEDNINNESDFIKALKKNPNSYYNYEAFDCCESIIAYSEREYEVVIETDERRYKKKFNNYFEASEWMDEEVERLDSEGVKNCYIA